MRLPGSPEREEALAALAQAAHQDEPLCAAAIGALRDMEPRAILSTFCCRLAALGGESRALPGDVVRAACGTHACARRG